MLAQRYLRTVTVKMPRPGYGGNAFEATGHTLQAAVQPMSGELSARAYGLEPSQMRRMLCHLPAEIQAGDGVCVEVAAEADPDYRVVYAAAWTRHVDIHLRYIPPPQRGADE